MFARTLSCSVRASGLLLLVASLSTVACGPERPDAIVQADGAARAADFEQIVVAVANQASFEALDLEVPLDVRAAQGLVDGRPFTSLGQVDAVPWVGPVSLERMYAYGAAEGFDRDIALIELANQLTPEALRAFAGWQEDLIEARPFEDLSGVPTSAVSRLRDYADARNACTPSSVYAQNGNWFDTLDLAIEGTPSGTALLLCPGAYHMLPSVDAEHSLALHGMGTDTKVLGGGNELVTAEPLELVDLEWVVPTVVWNTRFTMRNVLATQPLEITHNLHLADGDVSVSDSVVRGRWEVLRDVELRFDSTFVVEGTTFSNSPVELYGHTDNSGTHLEVLFDACRFDGALGGLRVHGSNSSYSQGRTVTATLRDTEIHGTNRGLWLGNDVSVVFEGVDLGLGDSDNAVDIQYTSPGSSNTWDITNRADDTWGVCSRYGCDFE